MLVLIAQAKVNDHHCSKRVTPIESYHMCHYALELQECIAELSVVLFEEESSEVARQVLWCTRSNIKGVCYSMSR